MTGPKGVDIQSTLRRAYAKIDQLQTRVAELERRRHEPIAVIGMGMRFPGGGNDPASFWRLLHDGVDLVTEVPPDRWDIDAHFDPDPEAPRSEERRVGKDRSHQALAGGQG